MSLCVSSVYRPVASVSSGSVKCATASQICRCIGRELTLCSSVIAPLVCLRALCFAASRPIPAASPVCLRCVATAPRVASVLLVCCSVASVKPCRHSVSSMCWRFARVSPRRCCPCVTRVVRRRTCTSRRPYFLRRPHFVHLPRLALRYSLVTSVCSSVAPASRVAHSLRGGRVRGTSPVLLAARAPRRQPVARVSPLTCRRSPRPAPRRCAWPGGLVALSTANPAP